MPELDGGRRPHIHLCPDLCAARLRYGTSTVEIGGDLQQSRPKRISHRRDLDVMHTWSENAVILRWIARYQQASAAHGIRCGLRRETVHESWLSPRPVARFFLPDRRHEDVRQRVEVPKRLG